MGQAARSVHIDGAPAPFGRYARSRTEHAGIATKASLATLNGASTGGPRKNMHPIGAKWLRAAFVWCGDGVFQTHDAAEFAEITLESCITPIVACELLFDG
jgi:hypothetical protein